VADLQDANTDSRLSRLETITDSILNALEKIQNKLDSQGKINWAPVAIGVTIFFTVAGSVSTIYNARLSTINTTVEAIAKSTIELEKGTVEHRLKIQSSAEKIERLEEDVEKLDAKVRDLDR
jgi:ubiquinone biosynthesis protein UbiJ